MPRHLLLELGLEEVPARFIRSAMEQLKERTERWMTESRIAYGTVSAYATPRRLAVLIQDVADKQTDVHEEVKGPAKKIAHDASGEWSKAALGFARSQGVDPSEFFFKELNGVEYIYANKSSLGTNTADVLVEGLTSIIHAMTFPKNMRWGAKDMRFVRPIRWIVALHGEDVIPLEIAGVKAGRTTRGQRFLGDEAVIDAPLQYVERLRDSPSSLMWQNAKQILRTKFKSWQRARIGILRLRKICWKRYCSWLKPLPYCSVDSMKHS